MSVQSAMQERGHDVSKRKAHELSAEFQSSPGTVSRQATADGASSVRDLQSAMQERLPTPKQFAPGHLLLLFQKGALIAKTICQYFPTLPNKWVLAPNYLLVFLIVPNKGP